MRTNDKEHTRELSVIIPYRDFEELLSCGARIKEMEKSINQMEERYTAMMEIYREILDKVTQINRYL